MCYKNELAYKVTQTVSDSNDAQMQSWVRFAVWTSLKEAEMHWSPHTIVCMHA